MKPLEAPVGTFVLCDHAVEDRGKWNLLGVGWTALPPSHTRIQTFVTLHVPSEPTGPRDITIELTLYFSGEADGELEPVVATKAEVTVEIPDEAEERFRTPPSYMGYFPMVLRDAQLRPECGYLIELQIDGVPQNAVTFGTTGSAPEEAPLDV